MSASSNRVRFQVHVRISPPEDSTQEVSDIFVTDPEDPHSISLLDPFAADVVEHTFKYDKIYTDVQGQEDVWNDSARPVVDQLLKGNSGTLLAYGETGSGKSHSIFGPSLAPGQEGILPRTIKYLYSQIKSDPNRRLQLSLLEVRDGALKDLGRSHPHRQALMSLLKTRRRAVTPVVPRGAPSASLSKLELERDAAGLNIPPDLLPSLLPQTAGGKKTVPKVAEGEFGAAWTDVQVFEPSSDAQALDWIAGGLALRSAEEASVNAIGKNVHLLCLVRISGMQGSLIIADLAGCERISADASPAEVEASIQRQGDLSALGKVLTCVHAAASGAQGEVHVPFRDSALTRALQVSLGKQGVCVLLTCVASDGWRYEDSRATLLFADRVRAKTVPLLEVGQDGEGALQSRQRRALQAKLDALSLAAQKQDKALSQLQTSSSQVAPKGPVLKTVQASVPGASEETLLREEGLKRYGGAALSGKDVKTDPKMAYASPHAAASILQPTAPPLTQAMANTQQAANQALIASAVQQQQQQQQGKNGKGVRIGFEPSNAAVSSRSVNQQAGGDFNASSRDIPTKGGLGNTANRPLWLQQGGHSLVTNPQRIADILDLTFLETEQRVSGKGVSLSSEELAKVERGLEQLCGRSLEELVAAREMLFRDVAQFSLQREQLKSQVATEEGRALEAQAKLREAREEANEKEEAQQSEWQQARVALARVKDEVNDASINAAHRQMVLKEGHDHAVKLTDHATGALQRSLKTMLKEEVPVSLKRPLSVLAKELASLEESHLEHLQSSHAERLARIEASRLELLGDKDDEAEALLMKLDRSQARAEERLVTWTRTFGEELWVLRNQLSRLAMLAAVLRQIIEDLEEGRLPLNSPALASVTPLVSFPRAWQAGDLDRQPWTAIGNRPIPQFLKVQEKLRPGSSRASVSRTSSMRPAEREESRRRNFKGEPPLLPTEEQMVEPINAVSFNNTQTMSVASPNATLKSNGKIVSPSKRTASTLHPSTGIAPPAASTSRQTSDSAPHAPLEPTPLESAVPSDHASRRARSVEMVQPVHSFGEFGTQRMMQGAGASLGPSRVDVAARSRELARREGEAQRLLEEGPFEVLLPALLAQINKLKPLFNKARAYMLRTRAADLSEGLGLAPPASVAEPASVKLARAASTVASGLLQESLTQPHTIPRTGLSLQKMLAIASSQPMQESMVKTRHMTATQDMLAMAGNGKNINLRALASQGPEVINAAWHANQRVTPANASGHKPPFAQPGGIAVFNPQPTVASTLGGVSMRPGVGGGINQAGVMKRSDGFDPRRSNKFPARLGTHDSVALFADSEEHYNQLAKYGDARDMTTSDTKIARDILLLDAERAQRVANSLSRGEAKALLAALISRAAEIKAAMQQQSSPAAVNRLGADNGNSLNETGLLRAAMVGSPLPPAIEGGNSLSSNDNSSQVLLQGPETASLEALPSLSSGQSYEEAIRAAAVATHPRVQQAKYLRAEVLRLRAAKAKLEATLQQSRVGAALVEKRATKAGKTGGVAVRGFQGKFGVRPQMME